MNVISIALAALLGLTAIAGPARADSTRDPDDPLIYDFDDELVRGDLVRPDGEILTARRGGKKESLIRVREHFIGELLRSIEQL